MRKYIRPCGKTTDILPIAYILSFGLILAGQLIALPLEKLAEGQSPWLRIALQYFTFIGIWVVTLLVLNRKDSKA